jgi:hypothetical protein
MITGVALAWASSGCGLNCNDAYVNPLYRITVEDGVTGALICDADVTVSGAPARRSQLDCSYALEIPSSGEFATVAATKGGYTAASKDVSTAYEKDDCDHAIEEPVKLVLQPQ